VARSGVGARVAPGASLPTSVDDAEARSARLERARVIFVLKWAELGGAERQALLLARHLVEVEGAEVEVRGLSDREGRASALFREAGIPWRATRLKWRGSRPRTTARLVRAAVALRRSRPDVLLPYCEVPNVVCGLVWRYTGATTCIWNQRDTHPFTLADGFVRRSLRATPVVVSNSEHGADYLVTDHDAQRDRIRVVPNGVALPPAREGRSAWRQRLGLAADDLVFCSLAHMYVRKDHETLLRAWHRARAFLDGSTPGTLVLAGRPEGRRDVLEALARELRVEDSVRFVGDVEDVAGLLGASDVGVLSSPTEGCPNALLESMASGLPVVGTDIPGIREALGQVEEPFLVPGGDAEALGSALVRLSLDRELRARAGTRNRARQLALFGADRMLETSVRLIVDALAATGRTPEPEGAYAGAYL